MQQFFHTYYAPNNAVLVVTGDFDPAQTRGGCEQVLRARFRRQPQPPKPDITEPRQERRRSAASRIDSLANRPAIGLAYHMPERYTPEWYAFGLLDQILAQGRD